MDDDDTSSVVEDSDSSTACEEEYNTCTEDNVNELSEGGNRVLSSSEPDLNLPPS